MQIERLTKGAVWAEDLLRITVCFPSFHSPQLRRVLILRAVSDRPGNGVGMCRSSTAASLSGLLPVTPPHTNLCLRCAQDGPGHSGSFMP